MITKLELSEFTLIIGAIRKSFATCERQDMVGLSHHTLDIFRKE